MSRIGKSIVVCLLAAVLLVSMVGMASASEMMFWLDSDTDATSGQYIMWKDSKSECNGNVAIGVGSSKIWTANEPAQCGVGFSGGKNWHINMVRPASGSEEKFRVYIGYYDGSSFHPYADSGERTLGVDDTTLGFDMTTSAFTVPESKWLALKVESSTSITVNTAGGWSSTSWGSFITPPDYPYPELNTLVLLSVGLLTLVGYVAYRRRNDKK